MNRIVKLRKAKGLTQIGLALEMNISQKMISAYERGKNEPSVELLKKMAAFFHTSVDYLIGFTDIRTPIDKISESGFTKQELELIDNFRSLDRDNKLKAEGFIMALKR